MVSQRGGFYQQPGTHPPITVAAMAIAQYANGGPFYLFKCDLDWKVVGDWDCLSVEEAKMVATVHAFGERLEWYPE